MLTAGSRLGPYEIGAPLGAGGMGEVYRATDTHLGRGVAIKVLPDTLAHDVERVARLEHEARMLATLSHPNIAVIYGLEKSAGVHALVMELIEGPTLADRISNGAIEQEEALAIARQIADALSAAHEQGITHRDLKPSNVKVRSDGTVKVLDFGLAKAVNASPTPAHHGLTRSPTITTPAMTQAGVILGTAAYMSPEQARGQQVDKRADIWAFGVVLYEMFAGRGPFHGDTTSDTIAAVLKTEPDWKPIPARVRPVLEACLEKDPVRRLRDIGDVWRLLAPAAAPDGPTSKVPWMVAALATIVALAGIAFAWSSSRSVPPAPLAARLQLALPENVTLAVSSSFAVSPDGRKLVFAASGPDNVPRLWVRYLDSVDARPLPGTETQPTIPAPFWSPDSRFVVFATGGKLKKADLNGGPVQTICDLTGVAPGGSWNASGDIIFPSTLRGIMRVSALGGTPTQLTAVDTSRGETGHNNPRFLPDGRRFIYLRTSPDPRISGVYLGDLEAATGAQSASLLAPTTLSADYMPARSGSVGYLLFRREGSLLAQPFDEHTLRLSGEPTVVAEQLGSYFSGGLFSVSTNGVLVYRGQDAARASHLIVADRQGKTITQFGDPGAFSAVAIAPDGKRVVVRRTDFGASDLSLWLVDIASGRSRRLGRRTFSASAAVWSPDGTQIAHASSGDLFAMSINDDSRVETFLETDQDKRPLDWSSDGKLLLYLTSDPKTGDDLWVLPVKGDRKPVPLATSPASEFEGRFSPDARWVAFVSNDSGRYEVYVRALAPDMRAASAGVGEPIPVSRNGGTRPRWRADGRELFYLDPMRNLMSVEITPGATLQVGEPKRMFQLPVGTATSDTSGDGRTVAIVPLEQAAQAPFSILLNWQSALKP
jgi:eukaryotic-like serine/threonine-protein kinase